MTAKRFLGCATALTLLTGVLAVGAAGLVGTPTAPRSATAIPGNARATVKWVAPVSNGGAAITAYVVTPYVAGVALTPRVFNSPAASETVTLLTNAKTYTFKVAARNAKGTGPQSAATSPVTLASGSLVPKTPLPSDSTCAARVVPVREDRAVNAIPNATKGHQKNIPEKWLSRVTGNFSGTTDEILQWAACKWGINADIVRAQAAIESYWQMNVLGDYGTNAAACPPDHGLGVDGHAGQCPQSYGILQVRYPYHGPPAGRPTWPEAATSTAYNADYTYAIWRSCYEGDQSWLGGTYTAGDVWGCVGLWFSGQWHSAAADGYIARVKGYANPQIWNTASFINAN